MLHNKYARDIVHTIKLLHVPAQLYDIGNALHSRTVLCSLDLKHCFPRRRCINRQCNAGYHAKNSCDLCSCTGWGAYHTAQSVHLQRAVLRNKRDIKLGPQAAQLLCAAHACYAPSDHHAAHDCCALCLHTQQVARQLKVIFIAVCFL